MKDENSSTNLSANDVKVLSEIIVRQTLTALGVNVEDPKDLACLQADFRYMRNQRLGAEEMGRLIRKIGVTTIFGGLLYALWQGIRAAASFKGGTGL